MSAFEFKAGSAILSNGKSIPIANASITLKPTFGLSSMEAKEMRIRVAGYKCGKAVTMREDSTVDEIEKLIKLQMDYTPTISDKFGTTISIPNTILKQMFDSYTSLATSGTLCTASSASWIVGFDPVRKKYVSKLTTIAFDIEEAEYDTGEITLFAKAGTMYSGAVMNPNGYAVTQGGGFIGGLDLADGLPGTGIAIKTVNKTMLTNEDLKTPWVDVSTTSSSEIPLSPAQAARFSKYLEMIEEQRKKDADEQRRKMVDNYSNLQRINLNPFGVPPNPETSTAKPKDDFILDPKRKIRFEE